jgi:carbonic anhydrase
MNRARRDGVACLGLVLSLVWMCGCDRARAAAPPTKDQGATAVEADRALQMLTEGNGRFVAGRRMVRDEPKRRQELATSQAPIAVIVSCSDSRVPPELVFDQGLGDLFDVRTAGHVVGDMELGSIEYAAEHLGTRLVVVLGHARCGAVTAAVSGGEAPGHIPAVVKAIAPAVAETKSHPGDAVENAVRANVRDTVRALRSSDPVLSHLVHDGKLKIVGGRYDLDTGRVEFLAEEGH